MLRVTDDIPSDQCESMINRNVNANTKAVTEMEGICLGSGKGFRREFRELRSISQGTPPDEFIAISLKTKNAYMHLTVGYEVGKRGEARALCEKIAGSLVMKDL